MSYLNACTPILTQKPSKEVSLVNPCLSLILSEFNKVL